MKDPKIFLCFIIIKNVSDAISFARWCITSGFAKTAETQISLVVLWTPLLCVGPRLVFPDRWNGDGDWMHFFHFVSLRDLNFYQMPQHLTVFSLIYDTRWVSFVRSVLGRCHYVAQPVTCTTNANNKVSADLAKNWQMFYGLSMHTVREQQYKLCNQILKDEDESFSSGLQVSWRRFLSIPTLLHYSSQIIAIEVLTLWIKLYIKCTH